MKHLSCVLKDISAFKTVKDIGIEENSCAAFKHSELNKHNEYYN